MIERLKIILEEKKERRRELSNIRKTQIGKINTLITTAATITVVFAMFGSFLIKELNLISSMYIALILAGVALMVFSILLALCAYRLKFQDKLVLDDYHIEDSSNEKELYENLFKDYEESNYELVKENKVQLNGIKHSELSFFLGLVTIPGFVLVNLFTS